MLVINILQGLLGRGPIFLNLHQLYGLYPKIIRIKERWSAPFALVKVNIKMFLLVVKAQIGVRFNLASIFFMWHKNVFA